MPGNNVEIIRRAHELYRAGDLEAAIDQFSPRRSSGRRAGRVSSRGSTAEMECANGSGKRCSRWTSRWSSSTLVLIDREVVLAEYRLFGRGRGSAAPAGCSICFGFVMDWCTDGAPSIASKRHSRRPAIATNAASSSLSDGRRGERYLRLKPAPVQSVVLIKIHPAQRRCCLRARGAASQSSALCVGVAGRNSGSIDDAYRRRH